MFVHISPEPDAVGETISTLKFAERVSTVELGAARVNKDGADVKELKEQVLLFMLLFVLHDKLEKCLIFFFLAWKTLCLVFLSDVLS